VEDASGQVGQRMKNTYRLFDDASIFATHMVCLLSVRRFLLAFFLALPGMLSAQWEVGAASAPINPEDGAFIAGHSQNRRFSGVHDNLYVKAVVVSGQEGSIAIITVDCIGLLYPQFLDIRRKTAALLQDPQFDANQIVLSSTHTHAGPDVVGIWGPDLGHSGVDPAYLDRLTDTAAQLIVRAWKDRRTAKADYSVTRHGEGWVENISEPAELDRSVNSVRFMDKSGKPIATMTNFACHPTFVDAVHDKVSSDYVGGFYVRMDSAYGGVNLFLQGPIGGWVQPEHEAKTFEQAFLRGRGLADAVIQANYTAKKLRGSGLSYKRKKFMMPVTNPGFKALAAAGVIKRKMLDSVETEIAVFRIGKATFATHPGETVPAMGLQTKSMMKNKGPRFVMGLSMDAMGYILKPYFFDRGRNIPHAEYLCGMSVGKDAMPVVMGVLKELLEQ
jgi:hypothetical protein